MAPLQCKQMLIKRGTPTNKSQRDNTIDILKGIGIILMVIGHAGSPQLLHDYIYTFHMPLFFIASGYFFSVKSISNKLQFFIKKIKGIYKPFVLCSILFLLLHNIFFKIGIINDMYGSVDGATSHLYSIKEIAYHAFLIFAKMDGYEGFLLGAYWFMRALFLSSLILCFGTWVLNIIFKSAEKSIFTLAILCLITGGIIKYTHIHIPFIAQGGYREMVGVFFMSVGFFMRKYKEFLSKNSFVLIVCIIVSFALFIIHPASIEMKSGFVDWMIIPFSGISGTYVIYYLSQRWNKSNVIISYMGQKSLWILTLHLLVFKLSELLEIYIYDLPIQMIGCHTIIPPIDNCFFILHTVVAVSVPTFIAYVMTTKREA